MSLTLHPVCSPRYYGYYLAGFQEIHGARLQFTTKGFPRLRDPKDGCALILPQGERVFISANDFAEVNKEALEWADVVGQVNLDTDTELPSKVLPIGPSFGIPWQSTLGLASSILRAGVRSDPLRIPAMMRDYLPLQKTRSPLSDYVATPSSPSQVFLVANYWSQSPETNARRLRFLRAVRQADGIEFAGGFWSPLPLPEEYAEYHLSEPVGHAEYLRRTARSLAVFNTPAVHGCLGWKLGEYLALGKAIISTPLERRMPGEFRSGEQFHLVEDSEEAMLEALLRIAADEAYRRHLEAGARRYWEDHLSPIRVALRLTAAARGS
jgi:hypothetical protein